MTLSGALRMQKWRSPLLRSQSWQSSPLKPGVGQNVSVCSVDFSPWILIYLRMLHLLNRSAAFLWFLPYSASLFLILFHIQDSWVDLLVRVIFLDTVHWIYHGFFWLLQLPGWVLLLFPHQDGWPQPQALRPQEWRKLWPRHHQWRSLVLSGQRSGSVVLLTCFALP